MMHLLTQLLAGICGAALGLGWSWLEDRYFPDPEEAEWREEQKQARYLELAHQGIHPLLMMPCAPPNGSEVVPVPAPAPIPLVGTHKQRVAWSRQWRDTRNATLRAHGVDPGAVAPAAPPAHEAVPAAPAHR